MRKPQVVVFFGGSAENHDLSKESGYWACQYIPRSKYDAVPVRVTEDHKWQVPLGNLPQQGNVNRMMDMLGQAVPAVSPQQGLERLFRRPVAAFMTLLRGKGGDDGGMNHLGNTVHVPVIGASNRAYNVTSDKHMLSHVVDSLVSTPRTRLFKQHTPVETIADEARREFVPPFFIKPAHQEGSVGVEEIHSIDELLAASSRSSQNGHLMIQEHTPGTEVSVSLVEDERGTVHVLPPTVIIPKIGSYYDHMAKRRPGRVELKTADWKNDEQLRRAVNAARDVYDAVDCAGWVSIDIMMTDHGPVLLEVNTIPTFTEYTPFKHQLLAAGLHPSTLFDRLFQRSLNVNS